MGQYADFEKYCNDNELKLQSVMWYKAGINYTGDATKFLKAFEVIVWITIGTGAYVSLPENPLHRHNVIGSPVITRGEMCFTSDNQRVNITQKPLALMRHLINSFSRAGSNVRVLSLGSGSGTDAIAAAQVGRSCISMERDPMQYLQSVARARAAIAVHDDKISRMTDLESALVNGRMYFDPPPTHAGATFQWTVPVGRPENEDSTDSSTVSTVSAAAEVLAPSQEQRMCSECGSQVSGPPFELCVAQKCQRLICKRCWAKDEAWHKQKYCTSECMPDLPMDD